MTTIEIPSANQVAMKWKHYVVTLSVCALVVWAAFNPLANFVSPVQVALFACIPTIWAINGLVVNIARRVVPARSKPYLTAVFGCVLVMMLTIPPHGGFMLIFVVIPLAIWVLYSIGFVLIEPTQLKLRAIIFGFWLATILIVLGAHWYYALDARRAGDAYARVIERYKTEHGFYPPTWKPQVWCASGTATCLATSCTTASHLWFTRGHSRCTKPTTTISNITFGLFDRTELHQECHIGAKL